MVHDLNREPRLPFGDASFDGVILTVSVQYLTRPVEVFREVGRILRPGGPLVVTFYESDVSDEGGADMAGVWGRAADDVGEDVFAEGGGIFGDSGGGSECAAEGVFGPGVFGDGEEGRGRSTLRQAQGERRGSGLPLSWEQEWKGVSGDGFPAAPGMTMRMKVVHPLPSMDSRLRGNDGGGKG